VILYRLPEALVKRVIAVFWLMSGLLLVADGANAASLTINQVGADVVVTFSGAINTTGLTLNNNPGYVGNLINPSIAVTRVGLGTGCDEYDGVNGPGSWGSGSGTPITSHSGDFFGISGSGNYICVTYGYNSGAPINGIATYASTTLANLGLTAGIYTYTLPNDTITVSIGNPIPPASIPSLSEWTQLMLAVMAMTLMGRHFRKQQI